jgi:hypothetical protein
MTSTAPTLTVTVDRFHSCVDHGEARHHEDAEQQRVQRQGRHGAAERGTVAGREHRGQRVRIEEQRQRRAQGQRDVVELAVRSEQQPVIFPGRSRERLRAAVEDDTPATGGHDGSVLDAYAEETGVTPLPPMLELYRIRSDIADIAVSASRFRAPHSGDSDDDMSWEVLRSLVEHVST